MISLQGIKKYLEKSENPLIFFDDDSDGLCSFLLLKRYFEKGKGVVAGNYPDYHEYFLRKIGEHSPDLVVILDIPNISHEFVEKVNVPIIWIDHHPLVERKGIHYFNPRLINKKDLRPVSYWCYKIVERDFWIAMVGIVSDWDLSMIDDLYKKYSNLLPDKKEPGEIMFNSKFGKLARIYTFVLKGKTDDVRRYISVLSKINDPLELLEGKTARARFVLRKVEKLEKEYVLLLNKALKIKSGKSLVFTYLSYRNSFTGELANELTYRYPDKIIVVAREKNDDMRFSLRLQNYNLHKILEKSLVGLEGYGGGHEHACGGSVKKKDFKKFVANLEKYCR